MVALVWFLMDLEAQVVSINAFWDVNNGISRRSWQETKELFCYKRAMEMQPLLKVTIPNLVDERLINS
jgi:urocanate hydratase